MARTNRRRTLVVLPPEGWTPRPGLPGRTRSSCPKERPCEFINCRAHRWRVDAADRPGQRRAGRTPAPSIDCRGPSCVFDVVRDGERMSLPEIGRLMDFSGRNVQLIAQAAIRKLKRRGVDFAAFMALVGPA